MSGNPFRRSQKSAGDANLNPGPRAQNDDDMIAAAGNRFPSLTIEAPPLVNRPSSKTKTVRIASPPATTPISPQSFPSEPPSPVFTRSLSNTGSPPPPENDSSSDDDSDTDDPFDAEASDGEIDPAQQQMLQNTRRNSVITGHDTQPEQDDGSDPVRRTLAKFNSRPPRKPGDEAPKLSAPDPTQGKNKQPMDVDAFKRLLMTGNTGSPAGKETAGTSNNAPPHGQASESSSSTDTASVSRQSIFEPMPTLQTDTPRTSHELSPEDLDEEVRRLVRQDEKRKPPPPKTRHGKLIKSNPSTSTAPPETPREGRLASEGLASPLSPTSGITSDLNKPLPSPPTEYVNPSPSGSSEIPLVSPSMPKRPPTPPMTRRQSQRDPSKPGISRSASSKLSITTATHSPNASGQSPGSVPLKTPPAPPARRPHRSSSTASSQSQATLSDANVYKTTESESSIDTSIGERPKSPPLPPIARTVSGASTRSAKRISRPPGTLSGNAPPPPPPPRRGHGSSRGSMDSQRPIGLTNVGSDTARNNIETGPGGAELSRNVSESSTTNDILADLAALQKEVDDMRQKTLKGPS